MCLGLWGTQNTGGDVVMFTTGSHVFRIDSFQMEKRNQVFVIVPAL